jgi:hypothetical protein
MPVGETDSILFADGATAVRRDTLGGEIWTAAPHRVVMDSGDKLELDTPVVH